MGKSVPKCKECQYKVSELLQYQGRWGDGGENWECTHSFFDNPQHIKADNKTTSPQWCPLRSVDVKHIPREGIIKKYVIENERLHIVNGLLYDDEWNLIAKIKSITVWDKPE